MRAIPLVFLFLVQSAIAQTQYVFKRYSQDDGLGSNKVQYIAEDNRGFIWLGTEEGLTRFDGYTFKTYISDVSNSTSLPDNYVQRIDFDARGNILVKTQSGLSRYDARNDRFVRLLSYTDTSAALMMLPGINNDVWVCTPRQLLDLDAATGSYHSYALPQNFFKNTPNNVKMYLHGNRLWIAYDKEVLFFNLEQAKFFIVQCKDESGNSLVHPDGRKEILFSNGKTFMLHKQKLFIFSEADRNFHQSSRGKIPGGENDQLKNVILQDDKSALVATEQNELLRFYFADGKEEKVVLHLPDGKTIPDLHSMVSVSNDDDGTIWITTDGNGVFHFDPVKNSIEQFVYNPNDANSISSNAVISVYRDRSGVLWFSCRGQGLVKMEKIQKVFHPFVPGKKKSSGSPLDDQNVRAICELDKEHLLIGTFGGLFSFSKMDSTFNEVPWWHPVIQPSFNAIGALLRDHGGRIFVGRWGAGNILVFDPHKDKMISLVLENSESPPSCKIVRAFAERKNKNIWIGTVCGLFEVNEHLLDSISPGSELSIKSFQATDTSFISNTAIFSLLADNRNRLWIGTANGLCVLDETTGVFKKFFNNKNEPKSLPMNNVRSLLQDHYGMIWIGTNGGGLSRYDDASETFTTWTMKDGLPNDAVYAIQEDADSFLWLATNKGLCRFDPKNFSCRNFKLADGLQNSEFNTNAGFKTAEGELVFGGVKGFNFFNPELNIEKNIRQGVTITSIKVFDHNIPFDTALITLPHNQNYISFEFTAQSHFRSQDNQYSYMLEGVDRDWLFAGNRRYASYTNLSPGKYVFHVRITGNISSFNTEASMPIVIKPPWNRTPLALFLFAVAASAIVFLLFRLQRARVINSERSAARIREAELKALALEEKNLSAQRDLEKAKELEQAYNQLKAAQEQLVQQEKLASLGQLTAGIAHEIKNPLNFVNNFSEVSAEILDEMRNAVSEEERTRLSDELKQNLDKILRHSKRADGIVKNMLQHSRTGTGEKQPTDINALCDEFIHLAFHGIRAAHSSFQCEIEKKFFSNLPKVNVITQDIGRVLLNLFNNAFYAVYEREKMENAAQFHRVKAEIPYQPKVSVSTELNNASVIVKVHDNGSGIPDGIRQKIFEPFFTTKPAGVGTGLGLSLSYDMIKAFGGEIKADSRVNDFTEFTVTLPL